MILCGRVEKARQAAAQEGKLDGWYHDGAIHWRVGRPSMCDHICVHLRAHPKPDTRTRPPFTVPAHTQGPVPETRLDHGRRWCRSVVLRLFFGFGRGRCGHRHLQIDFVVVVLLDFSVALSHPRLESLCRRPCRTGDVPPAGERRLGRLELVEREARNTGANKSGRERRSGKGRAGSGSVVMQRVRRVVLLGGGI